MRTKQTAESIASQYSLKKIDYLDSLYNGVQAVGRDANQIHLTIIKATKRDADVVMVVGHNDDLTLFAQYLTGDGVPSMKKGSVAVLALPDGVEWKNIMP